MTDGEPVKLKVWTLDEIVADPDGWRLATIDQERRETSQMTDAQRDANWEAAKFIFGL